MKIASNANVSSIDATPGPEPVTREKAKAPAAQMLTRGSRGGATATVRALALTQRVMAIASASGNELTSCIGVVVAESAIDQVRRQIV